jgi:hypothetical protein
MIVGGDVVERGVLTAETAFDPVPFLDECARLLGDALPDGELIRETSEHLG